MSCAVCYFLSMFLVFNKLMPFLHLQVPLLPNPSAASMSPPPAEVASCPSFSSPALEDATNSGILGMSHLPAQVPVQDPASFWNGILGQIQTQQQNLSLPQLDPNLVVKNGFFEHGLAGPKSPLHTDKSNGTHFQQQVPVSAAKLPSHSHTLNQSGGVLFPDTLPSDLQQSISTFLNSTQNLNQLLVPWQVLHRQMGQLQVGGCLPNVRL